MSSVQPPLSRDTWSSWHTLLKAETCFAILMIRLMAKSVRLITLCKLQGWFACKERKPPDQTWLVDVPQKVDIRVLRTNLSILIVGNLVDWFRQGA